MLVSMQVTLKVKGALIFQKNGLSYQLLANVSAQLVRVVKEVDVVSCTTVPVVGRQRHGLCIGPVNGLLLSASHGVHQHASTSAQVDVVGVHLLQIGVRRLAIPGYFPFGV